MKNSGFPWIGKIPVDWNIQKVKSVFYRSKEEAHIEEPVVLSLARSGVKVRDISNNEGQLAESYYNYNPVLPGDLLINPMDLYSGANCSVSRVEGVISPAYINLRTKGNHSSVYYDYYFKTQYWAMALFAHGKGVSFDNRWTLNPNDLLNYAIPVPCYDEQQKIASFLDQKCAEIDAVIEKTKATIEEYKKLKQSVITEAVTKGIRGNRPMKDSGIEWIGEIPVGWEIVKMKHLGKCRNGLTYSPENLVSEENGILVLRSSNIKDRNLVFTDNVYVNSDIREELMVKSGDILICSRNGSRALVGKNALIPEGLNASFGAFMMVFRCQSPKYIQFILSSSLFSYYLGTFLTSTINQLTADNFNNMQIVYCADEIEQKEIADYLDQKCAEIDTLIAKKTTLLTELETYKKSLIYEYVTGKKEVGEDNVSTQVAVYSPYFPVIIKVNNLYNALKAFMFGILDKCNYDTGRVKLEKMMFVAQHSIGFDLGNEYSRAELGPLDSLFYQCEYDLVKDGCIIKNKKRNIRRIYYKPGRNNHKYKEEYNRYFADCDTEIDRIINIFKDYDAKKAERIATLFGAWNDAIIDKRQFTDEDIVEDVRNNWHEHKKEYKREEWLEDLEEMKKFNLIPKGYGKKTVIKKD